jgi:hypothetical protein
MYTACLFKLYCHTYCLSSYSAVCELSVQYHAYFGSSHVFLDWAKKYLMPALLDYNQLRTHECDGNIPVMSADVTLGTYDRLIRSAYLKLKIFTSVRSIPIVFLNTINWVQLCVCIQPYTTQGSLYCNVLITVKLKLHVSAFHRAIIRLICEEMFCIQMWLRVLNNNYFLRSKELTK